METALIIILVIIALYGNYKYYQTWKELHKSSERIEDLGKLTNRYWNDWQLAKVNVDKLKYDCEAIKRERDLQIIELEKINLEYFKSIHQNSIKILAQEEEIEKLKKYSKGMRKLNKDMIKKYVALNNELELLTKTAPFGKGNK